MSDKIDDGSEWAVNFLWQLAEQLGIRLEARRNRLLVWAPRKLALEDQESVTGWLVMADRYQTQLFRFVRSKEKADPSEDSTAVDLWKEGMRLGICLKTQGGWLAAHIPHPTNDKQRELIEQWMVAARAHEARLWRLIRFFEDEYARFTEEAGANDETPEIPDWVIHDWIDGPRK